MNEPDFGHYSSADIDWIGLASVSGDGDDVFMRGNFVRMKRITKIESEYCLRCIINLCGDRKCEGGTAATGRSHFLSLLLFRAAIARRQAPPKGTQTAFIKHCVSCSGVHERTNTPCARVEHQFSVHFFFCSVVHEFHIVST